MLFILILLQAALNRCLPNERHVLLLWYSTFDLVVTALIVAYLKKKKCALGGASSGALSPFGGGAFGLQLRCLPGRLCRNYHNLVWG